MAATYGAGDKATIKRQNSGVKGGDQRIVNIALKNPARVPALPAISWALLPQLPRLGRNVRQPGACQRRNDPPRDCQRDVSS